MKHTELYRTTILAIMESFQHLWLWSNNLQGDLPPELFLLSSLQSVSLHSNQLLGGTLSTLIGQLTSLEALGVYTTDLSGTIPTELGTLTNLLDITLLGNQLTGPIPTELGRLSQLSICFWILM
jgi:Leucine-rich repeat (LRR) protein